MGNTAGKNENIAERTCVCGRTFAKRFGRNVHGRTCPVERARSAAFVAAIEDGKDSAGIAEAVAAAVRAARAEQANRP